MVGVWFSYPGRSFTDPTQDRRREGDEGEHLGKIASSPAGPVGACDAARADKCCRKRREEHCEKAILGQGRQVVQLRYAAKAVSKAKRCNKHLDRVGRNKPGNGRNRHPCVKIVENKTCE